jgi:hypothetical protein
MAMKASKGILALLLAVLLAGWSRADVLILKDGQAISGKYQGGDPGGISFLVDGQYRRYSVSDIHSLTILPTSTTTSSAPSTPSYSTGRSTSSAPPAPSQSAPYPSSSSGGGYSTRSGSSGTSGTYGSSSGGYSGMGVTVPSGTTFTVRMIDPVDSSVNQVGETFRASLDEPLVIGGRTIAARGANVTTKLVSVEEAGRISGRSELALVLYDITINGRRYEITTEEVSQQGASRGSQSATRIGGLAAIGAVIGAIASGGKGAAQGAAAGAGAGTAIQVLTHGENVQIPAETRLEFTLARPLDL